MSRTVLQGFRATTLICPPLFYILAAEKERLAALKLWCRHRSNQVTALEMQGGPANEGPGHRDQVEAEAGQSSGERQDRGGSPSRAGEEHQGQAVGLEPSLMAGRLKAMKQWFRLKPNQVMEIHSGPSNDGSGPSHDVIVSRAIGPRDQARAAAGQSCEEREDRGRSPSRDGVRRRSQAVVLDPSLLPNYVTMEGD